MRVNAAGAPNQGEHRMDRTERQDRREAEVTPIVERRQAEPFIAPWRRRQIERAGGDPYRAVTDLTDRSAA